MDSQDFVRSAIKGLLERMMSLVETIDSPDPTLETAIFVMRNALVIAETEANTDAFARAAIENVGRAFALLVKSRFFERHAGNPSFGEAYAELVAFNNGVLSTLPEA